MMKKTVLLILVVSLVLLPLLAYQWPAAGGEISANFGQFSNNVVKQGMSISGNDSLLIKPAEYGEIIFEQSVDQPVMPSKRGHVLIMQNDEDIRTIYSDIDQLNYEEGMITNNDILGSAMPSLPGRRSFNISFYDNQRKQYVNPLLFIAQDKNIRLPLISAIFIRSNDGAVRPLISGMSIQSGAVEILVNANEYSASGSFQTQPYMASLEFMGETVNKIQFDAIGSDRGKAYIVGSSKVPVANLYDNEGRLRLGKIALMPGQVFITIKIADINGLETQRILRLVVS